MAQKVFSCPALPCNTVQTLCIFKFLKTFGSQLTVNQCIRFRELKTRTEDLIAALLTFANFLIFPLWERHVSTISLYPCLPWRWWYLCTALGDFPRISAVLWSWWKACDEKQQYYLSVTTHYWCIFFLLSNTFPFEQFFNNLTLLVLIPWTFCLLSVEYILHYYIGLVVVHWDTSS